MLFFSLVGEGGGGLSTAATLNLASSPKSECLEKGSNKDLSYYLSNSVFASLSKLYSRGKHNQVSDTSKLKMVLV